MRKELNDIAWQLCGLNRAYAVSGQGYIESVCSAYAFYLIRKTGKQNILLNNYDPNYKALCEVFRDAAKESFIDLDVVELVIDRISHFYNKASVDIFKVVKILEKYSLDDLKEFIVNSIYTLQGRDFEYVTNEKINQVAVKLLARQDEYQVLDIGCGPASFLSAISNEGRPRLSGYEINESMYLIAKIRLSLLNVPNNIVLQDVIKNPVIKGTYQAVFCQPPFGLKFDKYYYDYLNSIKSSFLPLSARTSSEWLFIDQVCKSLAPNGKAVLVVSANLLSKQTDAPFRRALLEKKMVEGVIVLPDGILEPYTSLKTAMLILSKKENDQVILYDYNSSHSRKDIFDADQLLQEYVDAESVDALQCIESGLNPTSVLGSKAIDDIDTPTELETVVEGLYPSSQMISTKFDYSETGNAKILTSLSIIDGQIDVGSLPKANVNLNKFEKYVLKENDVLMTTKSTKVKVSVANNLGDVPIIPIGGMIMIRTRPEKLDPYYLKIFLENKTGQELLKTIQTGTSIVNINIGSLKTLKVACPPIDKQAKVKEQYLLKLNELNKVRKELEKITEELSTIYDKSK